MKSSYNLFLDDIRQPSSVGNYIFPVSLRTLYRLEEWVIVRNYEEFVTTLLRDGIPAMVSFDHDLADIHYEPEEYKESFEYHEETGYEALKYLVTYCIDHSLPIPVCHFHTSNTVGKANMEAYLKSALNFLDDQNKKEQIKLWELKKKL